MFYPYSKCKTVACKALSTLLSASTHFLRFSWCSWSVKNLSFESSVFSQPTRMMGLVWVRLLHFSHYNTSLCMQGTGQFKSTTLVRFSYGTLAQDSKGLVLGARRGNRHLQNSLCCHIRGWTKGTKYTHHELRHRQFQRQLPLLSGTCSISQKGLVTALLSSHPNMLLISQFTGRKDIRISGIFFFLAASRIL